MQPIVVIPAVKKNIAFPDDLVKKLAGVPLIQRTLEKASAAFGRDQVHVLTDSEEIALLCSRLGVHSIRDATLRLDGFNFVETIGPYILSLIDSGSAILLLSPYAPLLKPETLRDAYRHFCRKNADLLIPVHSVCVRPYFPWHRPLSGLFSDDESQELAVESRAFVFLKGSLFGQSSERIVEIVPYPLDDPLIEIRSYEDWWLCEKLIKRRRIVFRVIGHKDVGMGHIFRSLALAHEISDHEIRFVCDTESGVAANKLAGYDYWLGIYDSSEIEDAIIDLKPDMVINDILNTSASYVRRLQQNGICVVNFEDLGSGAAEADLTINDLYDEPQIAGERILWGREWFFVRDEFRDAKPHQFSPHVSRLLITFGGTDPSDFTRRVLHTVLPYCRDQGIGLDVVTGEGYRHIDALEREVTELSASVDLEFIHATGVISHIMERCQIAICSNGRTVYELAHMNVPAIVISHHERELTHSFACEDNGFVPLGTWQEKSKESLMSALRRLVEDVGYRRRLFDNAQKANFADNQTKVVKRLLALLEEKEPRAVASGVEDRRCEDATRAVEAVELA